MVKLINLTPHPITIVVGDKRLDLPPSGQVARVVQTYVDVGNFALDGVAVPVVATTYGDITNLPDPEPGVLYLTSIVVAQAAWAAGRRDVLAPDTGPGAVRDSEGKIIGVTRLIGHPDLRL
jgi:hypothetical protein